MDPSALRRPPDNTKKERRLHAASFALLVYASAWIKVHYPLEFACALLNSQPMGFYSVSSIVARV